MGEIWMLPNYLHLWNINLSQTLITAFVTSVLFFLLIIIYNIVAKKNPTNWFVLACDMYLESIASFIENVWWNHFPKYWKTIAIFLFTYIFWNNILWVVWDMFALVVPSIHHYFRPATTDITFNAILAVLWVCWALYYWLSHWWLKFVEKYIPIRWLWIVPKVNSITTAVFKIFDVILWLFIWLLELIWELARIISLSLRLFWNILAWMVLLWLWITWAIAMFKFPLLLPIVVFIVELFVGFLQAFVFTLLVVVYFKMAWESH